MSAEAFDGRAWGEQPGLATPHEATVVDITSRISDPPVEAVDTEPALRLLPAIEPVVEKTETDAERFARLRAEALALAGKGRRKTPIIRQAPVTGGNFQPNTEIFTKGWSDPDLIKCCGQMLGAAALSRMSRQ